MGVAVGEDAAVLGDEPVAAAVSSRRHPDDGRVEGLAAAGPVEVGVTVGEDAAVLGDEPVAAAVRSRGHPDDGLVQLSSNQRSRRKRRYRS